MNHAEIAEVIGTQQNIEAADLHVLVKVLDHKFVYGRDRWLVTPVKGSKEKWVENFI